MKMHPQKNEIVVSSLQETIKEKIVLKVKPVERFKKKQRVAMKGLRNKNYVN